jgi:hypothetical protein
MIYLIWQKRNSDEYMISLWLSLLPTQGMVIAGVLRKSKSINRKGRKGNTQRAQRSKIQHINSVVLSVSSAHSALKTTFSTTPVKL